MEDRQFAALLDQADRRRRTGDHVGAIDMCKRALALDPDHPRAHAILALALLGAKRLHGASIEAGIALALDGNDTFCHYAAAAVRTAERRLDDAWAHCLVALEVDSTDISAHVLGATIRRLQGERDAARELLEQALAIKADDVEALVAMARVETDAGKLDVAAKWIETALTAEPDHQDAHVVAGWIALHRGNVADAEGHARFALQHDATDHDGLTLWTAIKARKNPLMGLWWRFNSFVSLRSEKGQMGVLIGSFVIVRLVVILAGALGWDGIERYVSLGWLAFCVYTWVAPVIFRRMLERELKSVILRNDY